LKLSNLFEQRTAKVDKDGVLTIEDFKDLRGHPIKWKPVGKDLWQAEDDQEKIFAIRDSKGKIARIAVEFPGVQLERVPWYEDSRFILPIAGSSLGILFLVSLAVLMRVGKRIFLRRRPRPAPQPGTIWLTFGPRMAAIIWVLFLGALAVFVIVKGDDIMPPTPSWFKWFALINWVTALALLLSLFAAVSAIRIWRRENLRWITKVKFSLVGLACVILSWVAIHWHLIGPSHRI